MQLPCILIERMNIQLMTMSPSQPPSVQRFAPPQTPKSVKRRFAGFRTVFALVLREMATTYGRSPGGYIWAIVEPVAGIALLTAIFSFGFRSPAIGINFPIFYATGMIPFMMYSDITGKIATSLLFSKALLAYPAVTYLDAVIGRFIVNFLTQLMVAYVVFTGILVIFETRTAPDPLKIALALLMAASLALGIGILNAFLFTMLPVWQRVWSIANRPLFIVSCIFFTFESIPQPYRGVLWWNPLVHVIGQMREAFYPTYDASYVSHLYVFGVSLISGLTGMVFLNRYNRDLLNS